MQLLYFNIDNGECVPAFTCLPSHRARITGSRIHSIEVSFNVTNIQNKGYDWFINQVKEENLSWEVEHPHLMKSLKRLALKMSVTHPFKYSNFEPSNHRFPFVLAWMRNRKFTERFFTDEEVT